ncbi:hypothetical protein [Candidatus Uabimicrobium amorphum]|uniref:Uncharacterized protein n=1 Tax=Uabimicrobium amorphum TaxID=2596890 RepID=A0A5S9IHA1_UABAM|nr:hypothetical protein [Candidatus Uabimicrobium amorphum]BBM81778.1 hypothetical protein UABAM_00117 [Candidatus Uabimicrobium amorphum]
MKIKFKCECGKRIKTSVKKIGRQLHCPLCQRKVTIPKIDSEAVLNLECDECKIPFSNNLDKCPSCHKIVEEENETTQEEFNHNRSSVIISPKNPANLYYIVWGVCIIISLISIVYIIVNLKTLKSIIG